MPPAKDVKVYKKILEQNKDIQDLLDKIVFDAQHGQIWFDENRMLLMHTSILGFLRKDLYLNAFLFVVVTKLACAMQK